MKKTKEIYLVPYAHLDTQWRWEFPTTINKYIKNTIDENLALFKKYPEHQFNFTGTLRYQMMKDYFPRRFEEIKRLVKENRWHLAGTCLDETDSLVPNIESNVRNILYGDRWQKKEFGKTSKDYMIPDCFGFPENLPTVMNHCGINGFSSNKLTWGSAVGVPFEIGKWVGPDGSEIVSAFNPCRYDSHLELPVFLNPSRLKRLKSLGESNDVWKSFQYYGVGDIGGAPFDYSVRHALLSIKHYEKKNKDIVVKQGAADAFFDQITLEEKNKMDSYQGDLLLTEHSAGTVTSATIMKRWNRKNEQMAFAAETAAVMAKQIAGLKYPNDKIIKAWERVIGSQMHDILPGTSTPLAYEYSQNDEVLALNAWTSIIEDSARAIAPYVRGDGSLLVFNPLEFDRNEVINFKYSGNYDSLYIEDYSGIKYATQIKVENKERVVSFKPQLKPMSWTRFKVVEGNVDHLQDLKMTYENNIYTLENLHVQVSVRDNGSIFSVYDKKLGKELLNEPIGYELLHENPKDFPAWNMDWNDRKKEPIHVIKEGGQVSILEDGPLRKTLRIVTTHNKSTFIKDISLCDDSDLVEFIETIKWFETGVSFKVSFDTTLNDSKATYNWESSRIVRPVNHEKQYEVPSRLWADLSSNDFGFSLVEDSKYGYDHPTANKPRLTLIYTPKVRLKNPFKDQASHDFGNHTIRYGIKMHNGSWKETDEVARKFNQPVRTFDVETVNKEQRDLSFITINTKQLGLTAVKKAEDEEGFVVRVSEKYGEDVSSTITFNQPIKEAFIVNGIEESITKVEFSGNELQVSVKANGIESYLVFFDTKELEVVQNEVHFDKNYPLIGSNKEEGPAVLPRELMEAKVYSGKVSLSINKDDKFNALKMNGEMLNLDDSFNHLMLLLGAETEKEESFVWLDSNKEEISTEKLVIPAITGFIGLWDTRIWKRKPTHHLYNRRDYTWVNPYKGLKSGYVNRNRVEFYTTHTHKNGHDQAYQYGYLFQETLKKPDNAKYLVLPKTNAFLVAATEYCENTLVKSNQYLIDQFDF